MKMVEKKCEKCGMDMGFVAPYRRFCSSCRRERNVESMRKCRAKKRQIRYRPGNAKGLLACVREADRLGMSYGQYMVKKEAGIREPTRRKP